MGTWQRIKQDPIVAGSVGLVLFVAALTQLWQTSRGQYERVYVRIEPQPDRPAEVTHTLEYPDAHLLFRRRAR